MTRTCLPIVLLLIGTPAALASEYVFDKAHTEIRFYVDHMGLSTSSGAFADYDGRLVFDPDEPQSSSVEMVIRTASIDMDHAEKEKHLRSEDFFNVEQYPEMRFVSERVEATGPDTMKVHGDLTLLGTTRPVTLDVTLNAHKPHPFSGKMTAGFSATTTIRRSDFGMDYLLNLVGDEITIDIDTETTLKEDA